MSNQIQQLVHALIEATDKQTKDWNKIVLSYTFISASYMNITCCREEEVQKITLYQSIENLIHNSLFHIHKDMYLQDPQRRSMDAMLYNNSKKAILMIYPLITMI